MALINQETFNSAVQENIEVLGLDPEEAVKEAVIQFESQGANLSNIIKELMLTSDDTAEIVSLVKYLIELNSTNATDPKQFIETLDSIAAKCDKGIQYKVQAGKSGAYEAILEALTKNTNNINILTSSLKAMVALLTKQPDLLDGRGIQTVKQQLQSTDDFDIKKLSLRWIRVCCIMHEMNRQKIFDANILENIKELLNDSSAEIIREVLAVIRALVLDDDIRVEFGKAHEHARIIASETLCHLMKILNRKSSISTDELLVNDLMLTLSSLMVRTEFCKKVEDAGGLELIQEVMNNYGQNEKIIRQCFKLLKALAGNDDCKAHIPQKYLVPVIVDALDKHKKSIPTVSAGLACIAALSLRSPENSKCLFDANAAEVIVSIMKAHPEEKAIQKTASWSIRNMVSRNKNQCEPFLRLGVESILHNNLKKFKEIEYDTKAALRDLNCNVQFKEEWTGKGGALTTGLCKDDK